MGSSTRTTAEQSESLQNIILKTFHKLKTENRSAAPEHLFLIACDEALGHLSLTELLSATE